MAKHYCHAIGCRQEVLPRLLMCGRHWRMVKPATQKDVWEHYRKGQEIDKKPSREYLLAARKAIREVAAKEHRSLQPEAAAQPDLWSINQSEPKGSLK